MTYLILVASELGQIMTRYDFLEARIVSLSNVRTYSNLILLLVNFLYVLGRIMTSYIFLDAIFVI